MNLSPSDVFHVAEAVLLSLGGGGLIVLSLSGFLGKVWANRLMQREIAKHDKELEQLKSKFEAVNKKIQAELDKTLHVHRVQFETEFKALTDIWAKVSAVRSSIVASPPRFGSDATQEQKLHELAPLVDRVKDSMDALKRAVDDQSPFYPADILEKLDELIVILVQEVRCLERDYSAGNDTAVSFWFELNPGFIEKFSGSADQVSELIRRRIESLSLYSE